MCQKGVCACSLTLGCNRLKLAPVSNKTVLRGTEFIFTSLSPSVQQPGVVATKRCSVVRGDATFRCLWSTGVIFVRV